MVQRQQHPREIYFYDFRNVAKLARHACTLHFSLSSFFSKILHRENNTQRQAKVSRSWRSSSLAATFCIQPSKYKFGMLLPRSSTFLPRYYESIYPWIGSSNFVENNRRYDSREVSPIFTYNLSDVACAFVRECTQTARARAHVRVPVHFHSSASFPRFLRCENNGIGIWRRGYLAHTWDTRERYYIPRRSLSRCATHVQAPPLVAHLAAHSRPDNQLCAKGTSSYAIQGVPSVTTDLKILTTILYALQNCARAKTSRHW